MEPVYKVNGSVYKWKFDAHGRPVDASTQEPAPSAGGTKEEKKKGARPVAVARMPGGSTRDAQTRRRARAVAH